MRRGYARAVLVAATALFGEAVFAWVVVSYVSLAYEHPDVAGGTALTMMLVPVLVVGCLVVAVCLALPVLAVARGVRRESWRAVLVISVVVAAVPVWGVGNSMRSALLPTLAWWLAAGIALAVAALAARAARRRTATVRAWRALGATAGAGLAAVLVAVGAGYGTYATGLATPYEPPLLSASSVEGRWVDGEGGSLLLTPDGRAVARDIVPEETQRAGAADRPGRHADQDERDGPDSCSGAGSWAYASERGGDPWRQRVRVSLHGCGSTLTWSVLGSPERPKLYHYVGDPDTQNLYVLRRT